ncbi:hypothetical protein D3C87_1707280 [compost metagenome]
MAAGAVGYTLFTGLARLVVSQHFARLFTFFKVMLGRDRFQYFGHLQQRHLRQRANVVAGECHR